MVGHGPRPFQWRPWKLEIKIVTNFIVCKWVLGFVFSDDWNDMPCSIIPVVVKRNLQSWRDCVQYLLSPILCFIKCCSDTWRNLILIVRRDFLTCSVIWAILKNRSYVSGVSICIFVALYVRMFVARASKVDGITSWCLGTNEILASINHGIAKGQTSALWDRHLDSSQFFCLLLTAKGV